MKQKMKMAQMEKMELKQQKIPAKFYGTWNEENAVDFEGGEATITHIILCKWNIQL